MNITPDYAIVNPMDTDSPVYHALMKRRSEITGSVSHLNTQVKKLKGELGHLDATLGIMGYDVSNLNQHAIKACTSGLFHRNELGRLILGNLREHKNGLCTFEIARLIILDKGWGAHDKRLMTALTTKIGKRLAKMRTRYGVDSRLVDGEWVWKIKS